MKNMRILLLLTLTFASLAGRAQQVRISNFTVDKLPAKEDALEQLFDIHFSLSELTPAMLEIVASPDSTCAGIWMDLYHIKKYGNEYYLKHKGDRTRLMDKNIHFTITMDKMAAEMYPVFCLSAKRNEQVISNQVQAGLKTK